MHPIPERRNATHPHPLLLRGGDLVADALADDLALELRKGQQNIEGEAEIVRDIFCGYAVLGSVRLLKDEFATRGIKSKSWTTASGRRIGGKPFSRGALYLILQNRLYRGEIVHKGQSHPGEHTPASPVKSEMTQAGRA